MVVLGGSKVSDKLAVIESLLPKVDKLLVGGGMCFTFLAAQGHSVGKSLLEPDQIETCRSLLAASDKIVLPTDVVVADARSAPTPRPGRSRPTRSRPTGSGLDIGRTSVASFAAELAGRATVFWNGPMGVFELAPFAAGTKGVAEAVAAVDGLSVVGGGDSAAAVRALGLDEDAFGHISTGGGASLEYLEGKTLPGVDVLADALMAPSAPTAHRRQLEDEPQPPRGHRADPEDRVQPQRGAADGGRGRRAARRSSTCAACRR